MVTCPLRAALEFAATTRVTVPFPLPLPPAVTAIQATLLEAFQPHPASVSTSMVNVPPAAGTTSLVRLNPTRHRAAAWATGICEPPTAIADARAVWAGFAATVYETDASPCPVVRLSVTHPASVDAVHAQSSVVATVIDPLPPLAGKAAGAGLDIVGLHFDPLGAVMESDGEVQADSTAASTRAMRKARTDRLRTCRPIAHVSPGDSQVTLQGFGELRELLMGVVHLFQQPFDPRDPVGVVFHVS